MATSYLRPVTIDMSGMTSTVQATSSDTLDSRLPAPTPDPLTCTPWLRDGSPGSSRPGPVRAHAEDALESVAARNRDPPIASLLSERRSGSSPIGPAALVESQRGVDDA